MAGPLRWMTRLALLVMLFSWTGLLNMSASAHPLDEGRQQVDFHFEAGQLIWTHALWLGPLIAQPVWAQLDTNGDGIISADEAAAFASQLRAQTDLKLDGASRAPNVIGVAVGPHEAFLSMPIAPQVVVTFEVPMQSGTHALTYHTAFEPRRVYLSAHFPSGNGVFVQAADTQTAQFTAQVTAPQAPAATSTALLPAVTPTPMQQRMPFQATSVAPIGVGMALVICVTFVMWALIVRRKRRPR